MRTPLTLLIALSATAAAAPPSDRPTAGGTCIDWRRVVTRSVIAPDVIEITLAGGARYRSRLPAACPHLDELNRAYVLELEDRQGGRLCGGERLRMIDPVVARGPGAPGFAVCRFGPFERVPPTG